jgi:hypothetical protein
MQLIATDTSFPRANKLHVNVHLLQMASVSIFVVTTVSCNHSPSYPKQDCFQARVQFPRRYPTLGCKCSSRRFLTIELSHLRGSQVLFTNYYSESFEQFVALAVLHSHRDVIIRYLVEFDECLKYCNQLTGTVRQVAKLCLGR